MIGYLQQCFEIAEHVGSSITVNVALRNRTMGMVAATS